MDTLISLIEKLCEDSEGAVLGDINTTLPLEAKELLIAELLKHPQFKNTKSFEFLEYPTFIENDGITVTECRTMKLMSDEEIDKLHEHTLEMVSKHTIVDGKIKMELVPKEVKPNYTLLNEHVKLYSVMISPTLYSEPDGYNELLVSPLTYNPKNFIPCQRIILSMSREKMQDDVAMGEAETDYKKHLHDLLDKGIEMLENRQTNYKITKCIMIRVTPDSYTEQK